MASRVAHLRRKFPIAKLSNTAVYMEFKKRHIKFKKIYIEHKTRNRAAEMNAHYIRTRTQIIDGLKVGKRVVWTDATLFERKTYQTKAFSLPNRPITVHEDDINRAQPFNLQLAFSF